MNNMNEKKLLNLDDITTTEDFLTYFSQYMPSGNYETESLYEKLQKKRWRMGTWGSDLEPQEKNMVVADMEDIWLRLTVL